MTQKIKGKEKGKLKQIKQNKGKVKKASTSNFNEIIKRTRSSNIKKKGFYKFKNMMIRNIKLQSKPTTKKVTKLGRSRVKKSGRSPK